MEEPAVRSWSGIWKPYLELLLCQNMWKPVPRVGVAQTHVLKLQGRSRGPVGADEAVPATQSFK